MEYRNSFLVNYNMYNQTANIIKNCIKLLIVIITVLSVSACEPEEDFGGSSYSESHVCGHKTKDGGYCKRIVSDGHRYCWQHR